jgi:nicotinate-nucleotide adenylyltransferase
MEHKLKKVGFFGGSFDPIHSGHLNLAIAIQESCGLDEILFVPARVSPFKQHQPPKASGEQRLEMIQLALADLPRFSVWAGELTREAPSYTIDSIKILRKTHSSDLHLILEGSSAQALPSWNEAEELLRLAPPLIGVSGGSPNTIFPGAVYVTIPRFEVSSTLVRDRLARGLYCGHLLVGSVLDYIRRNGLYRS